MKEPFQFKDNIYVYSVDRLIILYKELCDNCKWSEVNEAYNNIDNGNLEQWLDSIGESKLSYVVYTVKKENYRISYVPNKLKNVYEALSTELNNRKFFELLDIDQAIEITLKEYETLRAEILQNLSEITQRIFLGLAVIFTIASLALAPLSDFLGNQESITVNDLNLNNDNLQDTKVIISDIDSAFGTVSIKGNLNIQNKVNLFDEIKKKNSQANKSSIIPSIFMFVVLIPFLSLYLVYRSLFVIEKVTMIGQYIYFRIEKKLVNLTKLKIKIHKDSINNRNYDLDKDNEMTLDNIKNSQIKNYLTHLSWEHYVRISPSFIHPFDIFSILFLFTIIIVLSWCVVLFLLLTNDFSFWEDFCIIIFICICVAVELIFCVFCWLRVCQIRTSDKKDIQESIFQNPDNFDDIFDDVLKKMWDHH
ncbi:hypothetical protein [Cyanothece sp. BG0011]|uniref:hypothetical protein n=1 Tax=Cyanothece sp. BG0011 TaxID=2082950 RepID=UPI000D1DCDAC|nr:hypothetical protein [Cyanothece sp. BG0011]